MELNEYVEMKIAEYEKRTGIKLPAHNRSVLRDILQKEDAFWERVDLREDSNNYPVEGIDEEKEPRDY